MRYRHSESTPQSKAANEICPSDEPYDKNKRFTPCKDLTRGRGTSIARTSDQDSSRPSLGYLPCYHESPTWSPGETVTRVAGVVPTPSAIPIDLCHNHSKPARWQSLSRGRLSETIIRVREKGTQYWFWFFGIYLYIHTHEKGQPVSL
ncbi:hypothetical protein CH063_09232 [Colletotrichum higginsianum]|uniref:Uncharacterized protein n=1 Tax=Colletotrichum higginsianum (strain IMI 349063) TaxID=759273 RepID=H1VCS7_COLHI|nr:hypothetical protein CH063_09232 [Colletotrichum higginsianum]